MAEAQDFSPPPLRTAGWRLWQEISSVYELAPAELEILRQACQTADIISVIEDDLEDEPLSVKGSRGQSRPHPLLATIADQRRVLDQLIRSLALPMPGEAEGRRRSPQQVAAAQARWRQQKEADRGEVPGGSAGVPGESG